MPKRERIHFFLIDRDQLNEHTVPAVMDFLRYEGATVESNAPEGYYLLKCSNSPNEARAHSFGIKIERIEKTWSDSYPLDIIEWARAERAKKEMARGKNT